jgi:hypothetical protein
MIDLLMQKCEKDGYKISLMFATAFMAKHGSKIVPALKAIKNNIDSRMLFSPSTSPTN